LNHYLLIQDGSAYSLFGQAQVNILEHLQLSAGGRYSHETKKLPVALNALTKASGLQNIFGPDYLREKSWNDFSPEVMLSYRPTPDLNIYGGYKEGFLSGGFNANATNPAGGVVGGPVAAGIRSDYDQQVSKGWEVGIKASLLDHTLRTNLAFYTYEVTGLQVGVSINNNTAVIVGNAANVRDKGMEFDFNWRSPVEGLSFSGAAAYTNAKYITYFAQCYTGELSTLCKARPELNGSNGQDLSGQQVARAPEWTGNLGFNYETPVSSNIKLGLSGNWSFSSSYWTDSINSPLSRHPSYSLFDATVRVADVDDNWELALIGRNLGNKHTFIRGSGVPFTGSGTATANGVLADYQAVVDRGRQVMLRVSYKFGK
jgi:iron complex outermembrane recepter protein